MDHSESKQRTWLTKGQDIIDLGTNCSVIRKSESISGHNQISVIRVYNDSLMLAFVKYIVIIHRIPAQASLVK